MHREGTEFPLCHSPSENCPRASPGPGVAGPHLAHPVLRIYEKPSSPRPCNRLCLLNVVGKPVQTVLFHTFMYKVVREQKTFLLAKAHRAFLSCVTDAFRIHLRESA